LIYYRTGGDQTETLCAFAAAVRQFPRSKHRLNMNYMVMHRGHRALMKRPSPPSPASASLSAKRARCRQPNSFVLAYRAPTLANVGALFSRPELGTATPKQRSPVLMIASSMIVDDLLF
jgi:hypothetical protein